MMESRRLYVGRRARRWLAVPVLLLATAWLPAAAQAAEVDARVEAVQWPAWVERDGGRSPLQPGAVLTQRDRLITGPNARLLLRLADGSAVKVGERAELTLASVGRRSGGVLEAALEVGKGAFRFTTGVLDKVLGKREIKIRVATLTIGIRGTDVWGKSDAEQDLVLLIEGKISVSHAREGAPVAEQTLEKPLDYLLAPRGRPADLKVAAASQIALWAKETEIDAARPSGKARGRYGANVATVDSEAEALTLHAQLQANGYPVRLRPIAAAAGANGAAATTRYLVRVEQMDSRKGAETLAAELRQRVRAGK